MLHLMLYIFLTNRKKKVKTKLAKELFFISYIIFVLSNNNSKTDMSEKQQIF